MAKGMIFFEDYFNYMDDMTPEQFYQFMGLIRDLRYKGIDKDANEIEDKVVRLAWRSVRHSVGKSKKNAEDYDKRKKKEQEENVSVYSEPKAPNYDSKIEEAKQFYREGREDKAIYIVNQLKNKSGYTFDELMEMVTQ